MDEWTEFELEALPWLEEEDRCGHSWRLMWNSGLNRSLHQCRKCLVIKMFPNIYRRPSDPQGIMESLGSIDAILAE